MEKELDKNYILGNEAFVSEKYMDAINFYTQSLSSKSSRDPDVLLSRSHAFIKAEKYVEAKKDAEEAIALKPMDVKGRLRSGIASFHLGAYQDAKEAFSQGLRLDPNDSGLKQWTHWSDEKVKKVGGGPSSSSQQSQEIPQVVKKEKEAAPKSPKDVPAPPEPQVTHGWYQTASSVVVEVRIKNLSGEDLKIEFKPTSFDFKAKLPSGKDYSQEFNLCHPITPEQSTFRIMSTKVEINLKKAEGAHWPQLEGDGKSAIPSVVLSEELKCSMPPSYPTSSGKDWNKLEKELSKDAEEKLEGDAELNALFKKIYHDGNDEVRKAMNKSFTESGGTVLSTNWEDIKKDKVDVKPPEGMEFKSWES